MLYGLKNLKQIDKKVLRKSSTLGSILNFNFNESDYLKRPGKKMSGRVGREGPSQMLEALQLIKQID